MSPNNFVLDTSVVYKAFSTEEDSDLSRRIVNLHLGSRITIISPTLLIIEISNAWATKSTVSEETILNNIEEIYSWGIDLVEPDLEIMQQAVQFSRLHHVTVYDSLYLVLALRYDCSLITADEKFAKQVISPKVRLLGSLRGFLDVDSAELGAEGEI